MKTRANVFNWLIQWMNGAGVVWVFALTFLICADITGRTLFDRPLQAVPEIVALSLIACVFLQLAFAVDGARLTQADIFLSQIRRRSAGTAGGLERFFAITGALVLLAMTAGAWPDFLRAFRTSEFVGVEGIYTLPITPIKFIVVLGAVTASLSCLLSLVGRGEGQSRTANAWLIAGLAVAVTAAVVAFAWNLELSDRAIGALAIVAVLTFIALGMPIAIALLSVGFAGLGLLKRDFGIATDTLSLAAQGTISEYVFATVPLFVLMGLFVSVSEIGRDSFRAAQQVFGRIRGGLGVATVAANSVFAAITGISIASAAIFSKIAVPEMVERGYTSKFAVGLTAGSSVLGHADPSEPAADHLRSDRGGVHRRTVPRRHRAGGHPGRGVSQLPCWSWRASGRASSVIYSPERQAESGRDRGARAGLGRDGQAGPKPDNRPIPELAAGIRCSAYSPSQPLSCSFSVASTAAFSRPRRRAPRGPSRPCASPSCGAA